MLKYSDINGFIYRVFNENLSNLKRVVYLNPPTKGSKISYDNLMKIGFRLIKSNPKRASYFFNMARFNAKDKFYSDRATFWTYQATI